MKTMRTDDETLNQSCLYINTWGIQYNISYYININSRILRRLCKLYHFE